MVDLVLLPGLAADHRLFDHQVGALNGRVLVPEWPAVAPGESLAAFARRLADSLPSPVPDVVGGASFGGMVALEVAAVLRPKAVVLLGSCTTPLAIAPVLRAAGRLAGALPTEFFRARPWTSPLVLPRFGRLETPERRLFWSMASGTPPTFLRWGCRAVLSWRPTPVAVPVFHLHGSLDRIIPARRVRATELVEGGGHLLSLTHPVATSEFLARVLADAVA